MKWYRDLYIGEGVKGREDTFIRQIEEGGCPRKLWLITLAYNQKDLLDIRCAVSLAREDLARSLPMIVGLAKDKEEAVSLTESITRDCLEKTGDVDLRAFLSR